MVGWLAHFFAECGVWNVEFGVWSVDFFGWLAFGVWIFLAGWLLECGM